MTIRTSDLALATTLRLEGCEPDRMEMRDGHQACWVFLGRRALEVQDNYNAGSVRVEPRRYNVELRRTRDQLFKFLRSKGVRPVTRN